MRSNPELNTKKDFHLFELSLDYVETHHNKKVVKLNTTFNKRAVFKIPGEVGLFTFEELMNRFRH